jgi:hypothetical protein
MNAARGRKLKLTDTFCLADILKRTRISNDDVCLTFYLFFTLFSKGSKEIAWNSLLFNDIESTPKKYPVTFMLYTFGQELPYSICAIHCNPDFWRL